MNKKLFIPIAAIIIVIIIIVVVLVVKQKRQAEIESKTKLTKISQDKILFPTLSQNKDKILFFSNTKTPAFYEMDKDGQNIKQISDSFDTPEEIIWSPDKKMAIFKITYDQYIFEKYNSKFVSPGTPDQTLTTWLYNFDTKKLIKLNDNIYNVIWTKDNKIIYQYLIREQNINQLNLSQTDGSGPTKIIDLPGLIEYGYSLREESNNLILYSTPSDISNSTIYSVNLDKKELQKLKEVEGQTKAYEITNEKIIFTVPNNNTFAQIFVMDKDGSRQKSLGINTFQLIWTNSTPSTIVVAANSDQKNNSVLYALDLQKIKLTQIKNLSADNINIELLFTSIDGKTIYFVSNNTLYGLVLP